MAMLQVDGSTLRVRLSSLERLGAFISRDPEAPLTSVRDVRTTTDAWAELRGIRAPGTGIPGLIALGTRRYTGGKDFAAVYRKGPAVVVELEAAEYQRFVVSATDADSVAASLTSRH